MIAPIAGDDIQHLVDAWLGVDPGEWIDRLVPPELPQFDDEPPPAPEPTHFLPGSLEKMNIMRDRIAGGFSPYHPADASLVVVRVGPQRPDISPFDRHCVFSPRVYSFVSH